MKLIGGDFVAKDYESLEYMHNSIYSRNLNYKPYNERKAKIYFSEPDRGINEETGILLFIAGYVGNAESNIYKKMRRESADKYNLVTVQCDYFGCEFMQGTKRVTIPEFDIGILNKIFSKDEIDEIYCKDKLDFDKLIQVGRKYDFTLNVKEDLSDENLENFNDMGIMQALDNITAVLRVMSIIYENEFEFNTKKVILYGHSHGAYLGYLCNRFCPGLFSNIVDNSAWVYPEYLSGIRCEFYNLGKLKLEIGFEYLAAKLNFDNEIYDLNYLYNNFENNCNIVSYHGDMDELVSSHDKKEFCKKIPKCVYNEITENNVDGSVFKSTEHGLGANFINLFAYTYDKLEFKKDKLLNLPHEVVVKTGRHIYRFDYKDILPVLTIL
jgi:hypothetical protein